MNHSLRSTEAKPLASPSSDDSPLAQALARYAELQEQGSAPTPHEFAAQHPEMREELLACLQQMDWIGQVADDLSHGLLAGELTDGDGPPKERILGDYRILRQIGCGGMGVVYEAEQISLRRRVALKILAGAGMLDPRALARFKNEVHAAASLDHPHIVDIIGVGCERGIHYYAMRLIDGRTLAEVLDLIQQQCAADPGYQPSSLLGVASLRPPASAPLTDQPAEAAETRAKGASKTPRFQPDYFRSIAEIGAQAAEALDYAHDEGVIHRDIKPSNLILDSRGKLWVTDFGLARIESAESMTITGDLVGTLRYMSPEQAFAKRAAVDHRTDVYSLGATLYELLTLRPLIEAADREEVLNWLRDKEPTPLRRIVRQIPVDLETIVLKCLAKEPGDRYGTARELVEDLRKFAAGDEIKAKRPTLAKRASLFAKRNARALVAATITLGLFSIAGGAYGVQRYSQFEVTKRLIVDALEDCQRRQDLDKWSDALAAAQRANALASAGVASDRLKRRAANLLLDVEIAIALDEANATQQLLWEDRESNQKEMFQAIDNAYASVFSRLDVSFADMDDAQLIALLSARTISIPIAVALDNWSEKYPPDHPFRSKLLKVASSLDGDAARNRIRSTLLLPAKSQRPSLLNIAQGDEVLACSAATIQLLAGSLADMNEKDTAIALLRRALDRHPNDYLLNRRLGAYLSNKSPHEAIAYTVIANAHYNTATGNCALAHAYLQLGDADRAYSYAKRASELNAYFDFAHRIRADVLSNLNRLEEAESAAREAVRIGAKRKGNRLFLAELLSRQGRHSEALKEFEQELKAWPDFAHAHALYGDALARLGRHQDALKEMRKAIDCDSKLVFAYTLLGNLLADQLGDHNGAVAAYKEGLTRDAEDFSLNVHLGRVLGRASQHRDAVPYLRKALQIRPQDKSCKVLLADQLLRSGEVAPAHELFMELLNADPELLLARRNALIATRALARGIAGFIGPEADMIRARQIVLRQLNAFVALAGPIVGDAIVIEQVTMMVDDPVFESMRNPESLGRMPQPDRAQWEEIWQKLSALKQPAETPTSNSTSGGS